MSSKIDCRECMGTGGIERLSNCKRCAGTGKIAAHVVEPNKCGQCGATTTDLCNKNCCGFLESGNGARLDKVKELNQ